MSAELRYHPDADQVALATEFNESLAALLPIARLHQGAEESEPTWASLAALGLFGITLSEQHGGSELGMIEEALIVMQLGQCLASPSVLAAVGSSRAFISAGVSAGRTAAAYRHNERSIVVAGGAAKFVLLRSGIDAALYDADGAAISIDERLWLSELRECALTAKPLMMFDAVESLRLRLLDAAALAGIAEAALRMGVAYSLARSQFGRPIGGFQAVKHHCANMAMAARRARDQTTFAAVALEDRRTDAALQVDCALFVAGKAALENAATNIQIHGGIGFSEEADPHLLVKRAQVYLAIAGGLEAAGTRIAGYRV